MYIYISYGGKKAGACRQMDRYRQRALERVTKTSESGSGEAGGGRLLIDG